jgi:hypothetical protein
MTLAAVTAVTKWSIPRLLVEHRDQPFKRTISCGDACDRGVRGA